METELQSVRMLLKEEKQKSSRLEIEKEFFKQSYVACQKLVKNYEEVKRILSLSGDNPEDYIDQFFNHYDSKNEGVQNNV